MPSDKINEAVWWEGAAGHRYALEVLQHPLRRKMLILIANGIREAKQISMELDLAAPLAEYHLQMLEKGLVIEQAEGGWKLSPTGELYIEHVEAKR